MTARAALCLTAPNSMAHEVVWGASFDFFFDNREYKSEINWPQTLFGARIAPELGIRWAERHSLMMGIDLPLQAIQRQIASALDIIIHLGRLRDRSRRVLQIEEVTGWDPYGIRTRTLYEFREEGRKDEKIKGSLMKVGEIENRGKIMAAGYQGI